MDLYFSIMKVLKDNLSKTKTMIVGQTRIKLVKMMNLNISQVSKTDIYVKKPLLIIAEALNSICC